MIKEVVFEGDLDSGEKVKEWVLGMSKYVHVYAYPRELKDRLAIHNLNEKVAQWWRDLNLTKGIKEGKIYWVEFKKTV